MTYRPEFDIDLLFGQEREVTFAEALMIRGGHRLELKSDQAARATGNVFVEFRQRTGPSGISTSTADWWTIELDDNVFVTMKRERLHALSRQAYRLKGSVTGGDNENVGVLVPVDWLLRPWRPV